MYDIGVYTEGYVHHSFNSLAPGDTLWHCGTCSAFVEVMAWCLTALSHYLQECETSNLFDP